MKRTILELPLAEITFVAFDTETTGREPTRARLLEIAATSCRGIDGEIKGLKEWPAADRPPVGIVFWSFRVMVGLGFLMLFTGFCGAALLLTGRLDAARWYHMLHVAMIPSGFISVLAGWFTAEVGRQPYTVYGLLRTSESVSPVAAQSVGLSLLVFIGVYLCVFGAGVFSIVRQILGGPEEVEAIKPSASDESVFRAGLRPEERWEG